MKIFTIVFTATARKSIKKLAKKDRELVYAVIETLALNPTPPKAKKLSGRDGYRIRIGDLRIIYTFHRGELVVLVLDVGHRREIYR